MRTSAQEIAAAFQLPLFDWAPRYNIAPTQSVLVVRYSPTADAREIAILHWGLIPAWAADPSIGSRMINARAETLAEKPSFRGPLKSRRCLIIADGFYEWQRIGKKKQPYYITLTDGRPLAFAGLWECWRKSDRPLESCTIVTTDANDFMRPIHDRMPAILEPDECDAWLSPATALQDATALLRPYESADMIATAVSPVVNNPRHDEPDCIERLP